MINLTDIPTIPIYNQPMEICLSSVYHVSRYYGGNEHYLHHLALGLHKHHQLTYLTAFANPSRKTYPLCILPVHECLNKPLPHPSWISPPPLATCNLFHASGSGLPLLQAASWLKRNRPKVPRILTFQAVSNPENVLFKQAAKVESFLISQVFTHLITTSPHVFNVMKQQYPHLTHTFVPLFISDAFKKVISKNNKVYSSIRKQASIIICFAGVLDKHHEYKGLSDALHALLKLPAAYHLVVIGEGNHKSGFINMAHVLNLTKRVHFLGSIPHQHLPAYFREADVFILPSTSASEGFGMVAIEAMSQQTPVITTTAIGTADWFKSKNTVSLVPPHQPDLLAKAIQNTIKKPNAQKLANAFKFSQSLNFDQMLTNTMKVYENAIS
jgi:glycosyltransferase involved in cell wall biosynthesis